MDGMKFREWEAKNPKPLLGIFPWGGGREEGEEGNLFVVGSRRRKSQLGTENTPKPSPVYRKKQKAPFSNYSIHRGSAQPRSPGKNILALKSEPRRKGRGHFRTEDQIRRKESGPLTTDIQKDKSKPSKSRECLKNYGLRTKSGIQTGMGICMSSIVLQNPSGHTNHRHILKISQVIMRA